MRPPVWARALLAAVAGDSEAECVAGDLEEEFGYMSRNRGRSTVNRWYLSQVMRSLLPLLLLDRLWCLVYSQIPLKEGVDRAPGFLAVNLLALCVCAATSGSQTRRMRQALSSAVLAVAAGRSCDVGLHWFRPCHLCTPGLATGTGRLNIRFRAESDEVQMKWVLRIAGGFAALLIIAVAALLVLGHRAKAG